MFGIENMISVQYMKETACEYIGAPSPSQKELEAAAAKEMAAVEKAAKKEVEKNFLEDPKQQLDEDRKWVLDILNHHAKIGSKEVNLTWWNISDFPVGILWEGLEKLLLGENRFPKKLLMF
ncbi:hypothetical protein REG_1421 [Candidatus Regiella insecticola LSR1]|uniref:Uncharacterized protein n=1 Tax=Candidatus Regiella insecticola LSR1 TaxID=663321 RepID=E0WTQ1_9ENTR|nr:hypothetical protein [Candidatus Regiella insecticola]EFL91619.1 hypothetical protein REG_1421 [Candidatus Regiella insecticola LSR1]